MANNEKRHFLMVAAFHFAADGIAEKMKKNSHYRENSQFLGVELRGMCTINNKTVIHVNLTICV
jgi:hypothetical protein